MLQRALGKLSIDSVQFTETTTNNNMCASFVSFGSETRRDASCMTSPPTPPCSDGDSGDPLWNVAVHRAADWRRPANEVMPG